MRGVGSTYILYMYICTYRWREARRRLEGFRGTWEGWVRRWRNAWWVGDIFGVRESMERCKRCGWSKREVDG